MNLFNVGIIGTGGIAGLNQNIKDKKNLTHIKSLLNNKFIRVIGIADKNSSNLNKFSKKWLIKNKYLDYNDLLSENRIDILFIATPLESHLEILKKLNKYKIKKIFCEKPFLKSVNEFNIIKNILKNKIVLINYFRRWNKDLENLKNQINLKKFGKIYKVNFFYTKSLLNNGLHMVDMCVFFFGFPKTISTIKQYKTKFNSDSGYDFILHYKNFDVVFFHIPNVEYAFFESNMFFKNFKISLIDRFQKISIYKKEIDKDYNFINKTSLIKTINTQWDQCLNNAIKELIFSKKTNEIKHSQKDNIKIIKIYEKIVKN